ncbi:MAG: phosphoenolpyruvate hydrolase family protein [Actinomycetota bacterium]|nr:phosphoenolpyruvate hydrolase family protein [Actinomycetota bacterium]
MDQFVDQVINMGFSGVSNEPFVGIYGKDFADMLESSGIGFSREVELIKIADSKDVFTVAWAFDTEQAEKMANAGADIIGAMIGLTAGGLSGAKKTITLDDAAAETQKICDAVKKINKDIMVITHGGPFKDVETAKYSIQSTDAVGYASGSSGERVPTEAAIIDITKNYKSISLDK